jgi:hypothetical protein
VGEEPREACCRCAKRRQAPNEIKLVKVIGTDAAALSHFALDVAPEAALEQGGSVDRLLDTIRGRLGQYLPEFKVGRGPAIF